MIVECSHCQNVSATALSLGGFKSYDWKYFQAVSPTPTSTTIKERDGVAILFILGTHEATTGNGNIFPRSHPLRSPASLLSPTDQTQDVNGRVRLRPALTGNCLLTYVSVHRKPQDTAVEPKPATNTTNDVPMETSAEPITTPAPAAAPATRKRPRLDLTSEPRERKRGKTMFGLLVGTLNKAKTEDKERNATDAVRSSLPGCFFAIWIPQLVY